MLFVAVINYSDRTYFAVGSNTASTIRDYWECWNGGVMVSVSIDNLLTGDGIAQQPRRPGPYDQRKGPRLMSSWTGRMTFWSPLVRLLMKAGNEMDALR